jgi:uncharacterized membrane protein
LAFISNEQAGFARVVTDNATFAYICDVFVLPVSEKKAFQNGWYKP